MIRDPVTPPNPLDDDYDYGDSPSHDRVLKSMGNYYYEF
jgi:hypothetical protein